MAEKIEDEREVNYCFPYQSPSVDITEALCGRFFVGANPVKRGEDDITDTYLSKSLRIRRSGKDGLVELTGKTGDKAAVRVEKTDSITGSAADSLGNALGQLTVRKTRESFTLNGAAVDLVITIDTVESPMKVKMAEIECDESTFQRITADTTLKRNTKSAWDYFKRKIGIAGGPSSGKTVKARAIANELSCNYDVRAEQIIEFVRTYIARHGVPTFEMQPIIGAVQERMERDAAHNTVLVTDSPAFLSYIYAKYFMQGPLTGPRSFVLAQMYSLGLASLGSYSDLLLLRPQTVKEDGIRAQDDAAALDLYRQIKGFMDSHNASYMLCDCMKNVGEIVEEIYNINKL